MSDRWRSAKRCPARCSLLSAMVMVCVLFFLQPERTPAQAFPFYDEYESFSHQDKTEETWVLYPFFHTRETSSGIEKAITPLTSSYQSADNSRKEFDVLYPLYSYLYKAERQGVDDYHRYWQFPFYFDRRETRDGQVKRDRFVFPFWFNGSAENGGRYFIFFPFIWYAEDARLAVPLFPPRPQTFGAIFPLAGQFRDYWNRDYISFFLWPLFVYSNDGEGEDFHEVHSFLWPIFSHYGGPKVGGFRIWPLFSYVKKEDEFKRGYFLWPLGHFRKGQISSINKEEEETFLFIPFYGKIRRPNLKFDMIFPFYGKLEVGKRETTGYLLALYNREKNYRQGTLEQRLFWFLFRRKTVLPGYDEEEVSQKASTGGGFFPFYVRYARDKRTRVTWLWPLGHYRYTDYSDEEFERRYFIPFYSSQVHRYDNGDTEVQRFLFPFFRYKKSREGDSYQNALHLFFYSFDSAADRTYAPLWTFWEKREDKESGATTTRVMKNAYIHEELEDGSERKELNLLLFDYEKVKRPGEPVEGHTRFLFGLVGRHRTPELKTELFGFKF